ncbi:efflux RND transporter permease subunit [Anaeromyxobacter diazotrophicus]|uniref:Cation transporter n=1 Tax=Anaeromyxobacter diazotrophicus TaxID=2590199 RepID=A0A7I9VJV6_9BACT|nr:CusA/CzcA family heavy metal efflux RND transporter [Anaeromyxobacter diazotrophicus]GEJ56682.1 cation transporter [Anaeromyxobacter diazotrophicus]
MIGRVVAWSVAHRLFIVCATLLLMIAGTVVGARLKFDALPDTTNNQVLVLTRAPGLTPEEVERLVTRPIEAALGGMPGLEEERSISRYGISSVTAVFADEVDTYLARQIVKERLDGLTGSFPPGVTAPELGPVTGGLGEIFHFTVSSHRRTAAELLDLATLRIAPLLRAVPGVVEVNTWGGQQRTIDVKADPLRMAQRGLTLEDLRVGLQDATGTAAGASLAAGSAQTLLRAVALPKDASELGHALVFRRGDPSPVRLAEVADLAQGELPRIGAATSGGRGETVYLMAQMLRGDNALEVMKRVHDRMDAVRRALPEDVRIEVVYDRSHLVNATLHTVFKNLAEGGLLVVAVLFFMLGSFRAGLLVASAIPLSMLGATAAMVALGVPGNLMSLGALDFGLLVDGAVVMVESVFHGLAPAGFAGLSASAAREKMRAHVARVTQGAAQPVFFSVLVILLVYVPVLSLTGVDGKMFRPMALTVVFALVGALVLTLTFVPAAASLVLRPKDVPEREPWLVRAIHRGYEPLLAATVRRPRAVAAGSLALIAVALVLFVRAGSEFVPQLDEGDLVVQTTRAADISLESAVRDAGRLEAAVVAAVPEVKQVVSRVGSPAVATDIMGIEQADVFVTLKPRDQWRPGLTKEQLVAEVDRAIASHAPGGEPSFTQPIQMRFNELLGGSVADVTVSVYGEDLLELRRVAEQVAEVVGKQAGAEDARVIAPLAVSLLEVRPRPLDASRAGFTVREVLDAVQAVRTGIEVGATYDGPLRIPIQLRLGDPPSAFTLADLSIPAPSGGLVPLSRVAEVVRTSAPSLVSRQGGERRLVVGFNVRGADLGSVVKSAEAAVNAAVQLPRGYRLEWGGQYETLQAAKRRLLVVIPAVLALIVGVLLFAFRKVRPAAIIFLNVPFATVGGMIALGLRGMPVSISSAVGFIALSGVAVLNGVVLMSRLLELEREGRSPSEAAVEAARERARPVLMTALVAALGFLPMAVATGVGAEVQRPLATVVCGGLVTSTVLTLLILPTLYPWVAQARVGRKEQLAA